MLLRVLVLWKMLSFDHTSWSPPRSRRLAFGLRVPCAVQDMHFLLEFSSEMMKEKLVANSAKRAHRSVLILPGSGSVFWLDKLVRTICTPSYHLYFCWMPRLWTKCMSAHGFRR